MTKRVHFFPNGTTRVVDEQGASMPELQHSWLTVFADFLDEHDEDPTEFEFVLPDGRRMKVFENENGWYGEFVE
jgi:hypothetical protein